LVIHATVKKSFHEAQAVPAEVNSDQEIEDDEACKPMHTKKIERFELKAGRHHPFRMDRLKVLTYEEESVELSSGML
jgi:hypothetical protein